MSGWLASVVNVAEARLVLSAGADIIDAKNPLAGALGALRASTVRSIVEAVNGQAMVSATIGDFPDMLPQDMIPAVAGMVSTGVDFVKIGLFPSPHLLQTIEALSSIAKSHRLVAVLFADQNPDFGIIKHLAAFGFGGVMLDTSQKYAGGLLRYQSLGRLGAFVREVRELRMVSGLAGSLRRSEIPNLTGLGADYLGFRSALCRNHVRTQFIDMDAVNAIARSIRYEAASAL